jgi:uncharacterized beta-barrel protein YwiB (DUF1934 family)
MTGDVRIRITGEHRQEGEAKEPVQTDVRGKYYSRNGWHFLLFAEHREGEPTPVKTTVKFNDAEIEVIRRGGGETRMHFAEGVAHPTLYQTPMGALELVVEADHVGVSEEEQQITAETSYRLLAGGTKVQDSIVRITVTPWEDA